MQYNPPTYEAPVYVVDANLVLATPISFCLPLSALVSLCLLLSAAIRPLLTPSSLSRLASDPSWADPSDVNLHPISFNQLDTRTDPPLDRISHDGWYKVVDGRPRYVTMMILMTIRTN
jgi:hypothetical protein